MARQLDGFGTPVAVPTPGPTEHQKVDEKSVMLWWKVTNTTGGNLTFGLYHVPAEESLVVADHAIADGVVVPADDAISETLLKVLDVGDGLHLAGSGPGLVFHCTIRPED